MRLIDADEFYRKELERCGTAPKVGSCTGDNNLLLLELRNASTVDAEPVRHGKWEDLIPAEEKRWKWDCIMKCSECGEMYGDNRFKYCPNCGARMDGE